jgi:hypothetical protein
MNTKPEMTVEQRTLEKLELGLRLELDKHILGADVQFVEQWAQNRVGVHMRGYLWSERLGSESVEYPADWWQHFKQRWFPCWALRRWPCKMTRRVFVAKAIYPDYRAIFPKQRVMMAMMEDHGLE